MVEVETVSGGKKVVVCPECRDPVLDSHDATLVDGVVVHSDCDIDPDDPETLVHWMDGEE